MAAVLRLFGRNSASGPESGGCGHLNQPEMPGHWADFLLIDRDIFRLVPAEIAATRVLESWVGGKRAWVASPAPATAPSVPQVSQERWR